MLSDDDDDDTAAVDDWKVVCDDDALIESEGVVEENAYVLEMAAAQAAMVRAEVFMVRFYCSPTATIVRLNSKQQLVLRLQAYHIHIVIAG